MCIIFALQSNIMCIASFKQAFKLEDEGVGYAMPEARADTGNTQATPGNLNSHLDRSQSARGPSTMQHQRRFGGSGGKGRGGKGGYKLNDMMRQQYGNILPFVFIAWHSYAIVVLEHAHSVLTRVFLTGNVPMPAQDGVFVTPEPVKLDQGNITFAAAGAGERDLSGQFAIEALFCTECKQSFPNERCKLTCLCYALHVLYHV